MPQRDVVGAAAVHADHLDRVQKIDFLQSLDLLALPTVYRESKGLPVLEACYKEANEFYNGIAAQNLASIQELTAAQTTFRALVEDVRSIAHGEASRDLDRVLASVVGSNEALVQLLPPALEARNDVGAVRALLASTNEALRELAAALPRRFEPTHGPGRDAAPVTPAAWPQPPDPSRPPYPSQPPYPSPPPYVPSRAEVRPPRHRRVSTRVLTGVLVFGIGFVAVLTILGG